jgi:glucose/arabinose dehydrogenase
LEPLEDRCLLDSVPFTIGGDPRVHPEDFRITTFATGLNFPYSMQQLSDRSLLVGTSQPVSGNFYNSVGELVRFVDANQDGVADGPDTVLYTGLPGALTAVRQAGTLFFVTSTQSGSESISVLRAGATPADPLTLLGSINFSFPSGWEHTTFENAVQPVAGQPGYYTLYFNVGSQVNDAKTTATVPLSGLLTGTVNGDAIYEVTVQDTGGVPNFTNLTQIATGLRNAAGMTFDPRSGDFYFEDNGIDGGGSPEEELSADEINRIKAADIGKSIPDFGFPSDYIDYFTGKEVGSGGVQPFVAFVPGSGPEIAGPAEIAFAPQQFPAGLRNGIFVGFHGLFDLGGTANDENPVAYVDLSTHSYFRFIPNSVAGVGHLDGLLSTSDSLFLADLSSNGDIFNSTQTGVIYQIKAEPPVLAPIPDQSITEGSTLTLTASVSDPDQSSDTLQFSIVNPPSGASIDPNSGVFAWTPADGRIVKSITIRVLDVNANLSSTTTFRVTVSTVAPAVSISGASTAIEDTTYTLALSAAYNGDPDGDTITTWVIVWGDGSNSRITGNPSSATHSYANEGTYTITASASDDDSNYRAATNVVVTVSETAAARRHQTLGRDSRDALSAVLAMLMDDPHASARDHGLWQG